jgi:hypothetical protein
VFNELVINLFHTPSEVLFNRQGKVAATRFFDSSISRLFSKNIRLQMDSVFISSKFLFFCEAPKRLGKIAGKWYIWGRTVTLIQQRVVG